MKSIRIGNDINVNWKVFTRDGNKYPLDDKILRIWLLSGPYKKEITEFSLAHRNELSFTIDAKEITRYGVYKLLLVAKDEDTGLEDASFDVDYVFQIVSKYYVSTNEEVLDGDVSISPVTIIENITGYGNDGESAYEIAVRNGFIGTEQDWLESLRANVVLYGSVGDAVDGAMTQKAVTENLAGKVSSENVENIVYLTSAEYEALSVKDPNTIYIVTDGGEELYMTLYDGTGTSRTGAMTQKAVTDALETKQDVIQDLSTIRSGAASGATAVQPAALNAKQDVIEDLETIRSGAASGSTAIQPTQIEDVVRHVDTGALEPLLDPSDYATTEQLDQLGQDVEAIIGGTITEATNAGTSSSFWKDNNGVIGYQASGMGLHRADAIAISPGMQIDIVTTIGNESANVGFVCDADDNILQTIPRAGATTTASFVAPANSAKFYLNYLSTYSFTKDGLLDSKQDKLTFDNVPTLGSDNPVKSGGVYDAIQNSQSGSIDYSSQTKTAGSRWINNNGVLGTQNTSYDSRVSAIPAKSGEHFRFRTVQYANSTLPVGFFCDADNNILQELSTRVNFGMIVAPQGSAYLYLNYYEYANTSFECISYGVIEDKIEEYLEYGIGKPGEFILDESMFVVCSVSGKTGLRAGGTTQITTLSAIHIFAGATLYYKTIDSYRVSFFFYRKNGSFIRQIGWLSGTGETGTPLDAYYMLISIANPSGGSGTPTLALSGLELSADKTPAPGLSRKYLVPMYAPSPQLPADGSEDADFNAETLTPAQLFSAFSDLIAGVSAPNGAYNNPKSITIYEEPGRDASNTFDINAYVITRRNRYGWLNAKPLYSWKNGSTIVYTDSISPRVGDSVYSDTARTASGHNVTSYSVSSGIVANGTTYARNESGDYAGDYIYTDKCSNASGTTTQAQTYLPTDIYSATGTGVSFTGTQLTYGGKTYNRCSSLDVHTDIKATLVIWGNEHGPQSDPAECAIVLYRFAKDLVTGCRNHPFISYIQQYCKVVLIPCANPYGLANHTRNNANNVNINRNYSTPGWSSVSDSDKGSYAGSENETQFVMNMISLFGASVAIDIHCLGYVSSSANDGCVEIAGVIKSPSDKGMVENALGNLGFYVGDYGAGNYNTSSNGDAWIAYKGISGGLIEMNAGKYAVSADGNQHKSAELEADYTLLLNALWMWYRGYDITFDTAGIYNI